MLDLGIVNRIDHARHQSLGGGPDQTKSGIDYRRHNDAVVPVKLGNVDCTTNVHFRVDIVGQTRQSRDDRREQGRHRSPVDAPDIPVAAVWLIEGRKVEVLFLDDVEVGDQDTLFDQSQFGISLK